MRSPKKFYGPRARKMILNFITCLFNYAHTRTIQDFLSDPKSNSIQHQIKTWPGTLIHTANGISFEPLQWKIVKDYGSLLYLPCSDILHAVQCRALKSIDKLISWTSTEEKNVQFGKLRKFSYSNGHLLYNE